MSMTDEYSSITLPKKSALLTMYLLIPLGIFAIGFGPYFALRNRLPEELASHFDASGSPDGSMSVPQFLLVTGIVMGLGAAGCIVVTAFGRKIVQPLAYTSAFLGGFVGGLGAGILATTVLSQRDLTSWTAATSPTWTILLSVVVATAIGAAATRAMTGIPLKPSPEPTPAQMPTLDLAESQHAVWHSTLRSPLALGAAAAALIFATVSFVLISWFAAVIGVVTGLALLALASQRVRVDSTGFHITYGYLPWPRTAIDVSRIARASAIDVRPMQWGGWGYRGSLTLMRQAALIHRAGPGLRLDLVDGKTFVVTLDDPTSPASLLNGVIDRAADRS